MGIEVAVGVAAAGFVASQIQRSNDAAQARRRAEEEIALIEEQTAAEVKRREQLTDDVIDNQRLAVLNSGTLLEGSPIMLFEETRTRANEEIESFKKIQSRKTKLTALGAERDDFLGGVVQDLAGAARTVAPFFSGTAATTTMTTESILNQAEGRTFFAPATNRGFGNIQRTA